MNKADQEAISNHAQRLSDRLRITVIDVAWRRKMRKRAAAIEAARTAAREKLMEANAAMGRPLSAAALDRMLDNLAHPFNSEKD
jgi:hypothetical protein